VDDHKNKLEEYEMRKYLHERKTKLIANKLQTRPRTYSFAKTCYRFYYNTLGSFHVLPDFLLIGAARSGSTSLYQGLVEHPNIHTSKTKEIQFFGTKYPRGINWYRYNFPSKFKKFSAKIKKEKFITGEGTIRSLDYPHVPKLVKQIIPNVKLILILRNPIDRAYSNYNSAVKNKKMTLSFEDAIKTEEARIKGEMEKMKEDMNYISYKYSLNAFLNRGKYYFAIKRWMDIFPKNQFFIIKSEDFFENTKKVFDKLHEFLGVSKFDFNPDVIYNERKYTPMESKTRDELIEYFRPYNEKLYKLLDRDFDWDK